MTGNRLAVPVAVLGLAGLLIGLVRPSAVPFASGLGWLYLGLGGAYVTSAVGATLLDRRRGPPVATAFLPAVAAPLAALAGYVLAGGIGIVGTPPGLLVLSLGGIGCAVALAFPLGALHDRRYRWVAAGGVLVAAVPLVALGLATRAPGPPEERGLLVLVGGLVLLAAPLVALAPYLLGRAVRAGSAASPTPTLAALAIPYVLVLVGAAATPGLVAETAPGPLLVVVPILVLSGICARLWAARR